MTLPVDITPPNSHPMVDVGMFAANLWFAADKKNWPLANYYLSEMRNRMLWETRLNPGPKGTDGKPVDMANIFDGIDHGSLTKIKDAVAMKDSKEFKLQYRALLEDCYSCHKTANRPYLRPQIPLSTAAARPIMNPRSQCNLAAIKQLRSTLERSDRVLREIYKPRR